jgi:hypothetical protein
MWVSAPVRRTELGGLLLYSVANGVIFGALLAGMYYVLESDGGRDFVSDTSIVADR